MNSMTGHGILILTLVALVGVAPGAQAQVHLQFTPEKIVTDLDSLETVAIVLEDTLDLRSFEVILHYDPGLVDLSCTLGEGLFSGACPDFFQGIDTDTPGTIRIYCVLLGADCWTSGPGEICRFQLGSVGMGRTQLTVASVALYAPQTGRIPDVMLDDLSVIVRDPALSVVPHLASGHQADLHACTPNPFNPRTLISYTLHEEANVNLRVLDLNGRLVTHLVAGRRQQPGQHQVTWEGTDRQGRPVPSGTYVYHLKCGDFTRTRTMSLIR